MDKKLMKSLFGTSYMPKINLQLKEVSMAAQKMAGKLSISGVQPKLSLKLNRKKKELEIADIEGEYILKPQTETFPNLPQNEYLCMSIASRLGIDVPPNTLISLKDKTLAYVVKRFDRIKGEKLHQEDFSQILGEKNKYDGSFERIGKKIKEISDIPGLDTQLFFERVLFFFVIGNGDAHLKNFSITYNKKARKRLSPAYDIVSSKLVIPDEEDLALTLNGKKNNINKNDFEKFAETLKIATRVSYRNILGKIGLISSSIKNSILSIDEKKKLLTIVKERSERLGTFQ